MRRKPRRSDESILSLGLGLSIAWQGLLVGLVGLAAFSFGYLQHGDVERARAMTFCVVVYAELLRALAARSQTMTLASWDCFQTHNFCWRSWFPGCSQVSVAVMPLTQRVFDVPAHTATEWIIVVLLALAPVTLIETGKVLLKRLRPVTG